MNTDLGVLQTSLDLDLGMEKIVNTNIFSEWIYYFILHIEGLENFQKELILLILKKINNGENLDINEHKILIDFMKSIQFYKKGASLMKRILFSTKIDELKFDFKDIKLFISNLEENILLMKGILYYYSNQDIELDIKEITLLPKSFKNKDKDRFKTLIERIKLLVAYIKGRNKKKSKLDISSIYLTNGEINLFSQSLKDLINKYGDKLKFNNVDSTNKKKTTIGEQLNNDLSRIKKNIKLLIFFLKSNNIKLLISSNSELLEKVNRILDNSEENRIELFDILSDLIDILSKKLLVLKELKTKIDQFFYDKQNLEFNFYNIFKYISDKIESKNVGDYIKNDLLKNLSDITNIFDGQNIDFLQGENLKILGKIDGQQDNIILKYLDSVCLVDKTGIIKKIDGIEIFGEIYSFNGIFYVKYKSLKNCKYGFLDLTNMNILKDFLFDEISSPIDLNIDGELLKIFIGKNSIQSKKVNQIKIVNLGSLSEITSNYNITNICNFYGVSKKGDNYILDKIDFPCESNGYIDVLIELNLSNNQNPNHKIIYSFKNGTYLGNNFNSVKIIGKGKSVRFKLKSGGFFDGKSSTFPLKDFYKD